MTNDYGYEDNEYVLNKSFDTIEDLVNAYYDMRQLTKTGDVPATMGTTNYRNILYGRKLWLQMNQKPNAFTCLPREPWDMSGYRMVPDFATTATTGNGVVEAGTIPDVKVPAVSVMDVNPKTIVNDPYAITMAQSKLAGRDDVVTWEELLNVMSNEFAMRVNAMVLKKNTDTDAPGSGSAAIAGYNLESIDRIISGSEEHTAHSGIAHGAVDVFGFDRHSSATAFDSKVNAAAATRPFDFALLDNVFSGVQPFWTTYDETDKVILTDYASVERVGTLALSQQRHLPYMGLKSSFRGVATIPGNNIGIGASLYRGVPIVPDYYVQNEGAGTLGRMYLIDTSTIGVKVLVPPQFIEDKSYIPRKNLTTVATFYMLGETVCTRFRSNGKVMDIN